MTEQASFIDELTRQLRDVLPEGIEVARNDFDRMVHTAVSSALSRMDLVTREEFDVQAAVLARSREKLEALIKQLAELEQQRNTK